MNVWRGRVGGHASWVRVGVVAALAMAVIAFHPRLARAQDITNITYGEGKFGVWAHDLHALGGTERGVDLNPELILWSPVTDDLIANVPWWLHWTLQPRPTVGASFNTAGDTDQAYAGWTWSWMLMHNVIRPDDGITFSIFFGPGFNDGHINGPPLGVPVTRQALGSHILFREAIETGYQINPTWNLSVYLDHISNAGLAKYNRSINDLGLRLGYRF
jgi:lipid A 3-O-deacylase